MPFTRPLLSKVTIFFVSRHCSSHLGHLSPIVTKLNDVRDDNTTYNNRVDTTLADVFSLLSLCYLTLGRTKECPAVYSQLASMRVSTPSLDYFSVDDERLAPWRPSRPLSTTVPIPYLKHSSTCMKIRTNHHLLFTANPQSHGRIGSLQ
jgi:hypothetical protein